MPKAKALDLILATKILPFFSAPSLEILSLPYPHSNNTLLSLFSTSGKWCKTQPFDTLGVVEIRELTVAMVNSMIGI